MQLINALLDMLVDGEFSIAPNTLIKVLHFCCPFSGTLDFLVSGIV